MHINLDLYRTFYAVATQLSFSKAAKALFISQSAVSQNISSLEMALETKLFQRSTKRVSLTPEGETLLSHIEPAINSILRGEQQLTEYKDLTRGHLHIGVSDTICKYYLIDYLKAFHEVYQGIDIEITNRTSIQCVQLLKNNQVDLILTNLPNDELGSNMEVIETRSFKDIVIAPTTYKELRTGKVTLEELANYPVLLLDKQSSTTRFLQKEYEKSNIALKPAIELGSIDLLVEMTKIGLGITFIPDYVYREDPGYYMVDTEISLPKRKLAIATRKNTPVGIATSKFIDLILDKPFQR